MRLDFIAPGVPVAQPRQRHAVRELSGGRVASVNYLPKDAPVNAFKTAVRLLAAQAMGGRPPTRSHVSVALTFVFARPKTLTLKRGGNPRLRHGARPDAENCAKSTLDALSGTVFVDDAQVSDLVALKRIAAGDEAPHTRVLVRELPASVGRGERSAAARAPLDGWTVSHAPAGGGSFTMALAHRP